MLFQRRFISVGMFLAVAAIAGCGGYAERHDGEAAARGLAAIGAAIDWNR